MYFPQNLIPDHT